nr:hypothetical protein [uncultured bacterium]
MWKTKYSKMVKRREKLARMIITLNNFFNRMELCFNLRRSRPIPRTIIKSTIPPKTATSSSQSSDDVPLNSGPDK